MVAVMSAEVRLDKGLQLLSLRCAVGNAEVLCEAAQSRLAGGLPEQRVLVRKVKVEAARRESYTQVTVDY
jgi:hypothetical protein